MGDEIDVLIGGDFYWKVFTGKVARGENGPIGLETKVGWVLSRVVGERKNETHTNFISHTHVLKIANARSLKNLDKNVKKFWDLESIGIKENEKSMYQELSDEIFINKEGRYEVNLPFKISHPVLPDYFEQCKKRFESKFNQLKNDPELLSKYDETFKEKQKLGIIEQVETPGKNWQTYYLPHHGIVREDKDTTKLRVLFDASSKTCNVSLNYCLLKGPNITPLIFDIF